MTQKSDSNIPNVLSPVVQGAFVNKGLVPDRQQKNIGSLPTTPTHNTLVVAATHGSGHSTPAKENKHGDKNLGFSVLYHNMKQGQAAVKFLQELLRESANTEDIYAKHLAKLAKQASNVPAVGTLAPMFDIVKVMAEKLSSCHVDVVLKLHDVIKELSKYLEEQKGKHKQVKDELSGTVDALNVIQSTANTLKRSKEKYHQQCSDAERLRKSGALQKDIEKAEAKSKKSSDEYRQLVGKYSGIRQDFEQKMTESAKRFQDVEEAHLKHMKSVLESYILSYENANVLVNQVHQEFRRQVNEHTADILVKQFSEAKGTGTEKPGPIVFEECDLSSVVVDTPVNGGTTDDSNPAPPSKPSTRLPIGLPFRRKKGVSRKAHKDTSSAGSKEADRDVESIESPDKDNSVKIDEEGFTIRPETPKSSKNSWGFDSSGSDSDSDDYTARKIHVKINPKEEAVAESAGSDMETLNAITRNLTLNSPTPIGGKRLSRRKSEQRKQAKPPAIAPRRQINSLSDGAELSDGSQDLVKSPSRGSHQSTNEAFVPSPLGTPVKLRKSTPVQLSGAVKVLPLQSRSQRNSPSTSPRNIPVPKPRLSISESSSKLVPPRLTENRFSTVFVPYDPSDEGRKEQPVARPRLQIPEPIPEGSAENCPSASKSVDDFEERRSFISARSGGATHVPSKSELNLSLRHLVESTELPMTSLIESETSRDCASDDGEKPGSWVSFGKDKTQKDRNHGTNYSHSNKSKESPAEKSEKSLTDELMDLFGNNTSNNAPNAPSKNAVVTAPMTSNSSDALAGLFASKPESPATAAKNVHPTTSSLPQSSSNVSLNNLFIMPSAEKEETSNGSPGNGLMMPVLESADKVGSTRPTELSLSNAHNKTPTATPSAPLASSESWSSLSSVGGTTPMDSFASSRGPSPLPLMHGDPIPIAVAFTETVNAYFKGADEQSKCMVKISGEMQISFPAGIVRAFTSNPNPAVLSFKVKGCPSVNDFTPHPTLLFADSSDPAHHNFWFNMPALTAHVKKMADANPNSPYYNIQILTYQMSSPAGHDLVPLHVSSYWQCENDFTDLRVTYKYNNKCTNATLKNLNVLVPVGGSVTSVQSEPSATWIASQNRLAWKLGTPVGSNTPPGTLHSKLSISSGPGKPSTLAVQFMSEGSTLSGADFELAGSGYRVSLTKRRFVSGKYLSDCT